MQQVVQGRYRLTRHVATSGVAETYQAVDTALDRHVAVKALRPEAARHENVVSRFLEMGRAAVALKHPNIVSVFEVGTDEDTSFVVMEWVEWPTLAKVLSLEASLPPWRVAEIGAEIASALTYAHGHGVLHRGLKPTDIFISPNGDVKVADFGMARVTEHVADLDARTALLAATYLSPERASGQRADERTDLYGLGIVLYEAVTGRPPLTADSPAQLAALHRDQLPMRPSAVNPAAGGDFERVLARLLAKDPASRYRDAEAVRADLLALAGTSAGAAGAVGAAAAAGAAEGAGVETAIADAMAEPTQVIRIDGRDTVAAAPLPPPVPVMGRRRPPWLLWAALGTVVLFIIILAIVLSGGGGGGANTVAVPSVVGTTREQATTELQRAGFRANPVNASNETVPVGVVFAQDPSPGAKVKKGATVTLSVSQGPATTTTEAPTTTLATVPPTTIRRVVPTTRRPVPTTRRTVPPTRPPTTTPTTTPGTSTTPVT